MKKLTTWLMLTVCALVISVSNGISGNNVPLNEKQSPDKGRGSTQVENCLPPTGHTDLDINNVRARINTGGDMWWDLMWKAEYEIPKGSGKHSMSLKALWFAGIDQNGQLRCAAQRYRQRGNDFWAGPLTTDGTASIDAYTCKLYDRHFKITREEVRAFIENHKNPIPGYVRPKIINEWPAHGNSAYGQDFYLAPFMDINGDGMYNPDDGDYPYFDFDGSACGTYFADRILYGDMSIWWVFNDKGNKHTESGGMSIGLEIRAQAFAFSTHDDINNMTFYNYQIINRSNNTINQMHFGQFVYPEIGYRYDEFIGCDVQRGLGYCYNGVAIDGSGAEDHYGENPPAVGVVFLQGPYMDPDGIDNPAGIDEGINGTNFGDGIIDNERYGMRRFLRLIKGPSAYQGHPVFSTEYYNLLRGKWRDGSPLWYGGHGSQNDPKSCGPAASFMYPGASDPLQWGTNYQVPTCYHNSWTEEAVGNSPYSRHFLQSAGPFTMAPGAVNSVTLGVPWARASTGGPKKSLELLLLATDKAQALFDNCFQITEGPHAPDLSLQELDRELILFITNKEISNNYNESYASVYHASLRGNNKKRGSDTLYFQGYQIFQLKHAGVTVNDLWDTDLAREIAQCDINDGIGRIINHYYDPYLEATVPIEKVNGSDKGIKRSFRITEDAFATTESKGLVNHKKYYFMAIAYACTKSKLYNPNDISTHDGQKLPYLAGRKQALSGLEVQAVTGIPHIPSPLSNGLVAQASYGYSPKITRIEGHGNGGLILDLTPETEAEIMAKTSAPFRAEKLTYKSGYGPIDIKVIDPLNVPDAKFQLKFVATDTLNGQYGADIKYSYPVANDTTASIYIKVGWELQNLNTGKIYYSDKNIGIQNEQIIPEIGLSVTIGQVPLPGDTTYIGNDYVYLDPKNNGFLEATISYSDNCNPWLDGLSDMDEASPLNWIRSGSAYTSNSPYYDYYHLFESALPRLFIDPNENYESIIGGKWSPYRLAAHDDVTTNPNTAYTDGIAFNNTPSVSIGFHRNAFMTRLYSIDLVLTPDKSKWSRCPVVEMQYDKVLSEGNAEKFLLRRAPSKDKNGNDIPGSTGMSWFPGYAINVETGERLNIMFGEDSWLVADNGNDMLFNPTERIFDDINLRAIFGGKHYVYIFGHNGDGPGYVPAYDEGAYIYEQLDSAAKMPTETSIQRIRKTQKIGEVYEHIMWCGIPLRSTLYKNDWLSCEVRIRIRVNRPYAQYYATGGATNQQNNNLPMYEFSTSDIATLTNVGETAINALELINIVPNPYYSSVAFASGDYQNRILLTNLPKKCKVSIFTMGGKLVKSIDVEKSGSANVRYAENDEARTSVTWDLKNEEGNQISSGIYLIRIQADGLGERVIKWYGYLWE